MVKYLNISDQLWYVIINEFIIISDYPSLDKIFSVTNLHKDKSYPKECKSR